MIVGLTGGIATGKSTVSRRFAELGAEVIDADLIAREIVEPGEPALAADHLAAIGLGDVELEHRRVLALDLLDANRLRVVDELLREPGQ